MQKNLDHLFPPSIGFIFIIYSRLFTFPRLTYPFFHSISTHNYSRFSLSLSFKFLQSHTPSLSTTHSRHHHHHLRHHHAAEESTPTTAQIIGTTTTALADAVGAHSDSRFSTGHQPDVDTTTHSTIVAIGSVGPKKVLFDHSSQRTTIAGCATLTCAPLGYSKHSEATAASSFARHDSRTDRCHRAPHEEGANKDYEQHSRSSGAGSFENKKPSVADDQPQGENEPLHDTAYWIFWWYDEAAKKRMEAATTSRTSEQASVPMPRTGDDPEVVRMIRELAMEGKKVKSVPRKEGARPMKWKRKAFKKHDHSLVLTESEHFEPEAEKDKPVKAVQPKQQERPKEAVQKERLTGSQLDVPRGDDARAMVNVGEEEDQDCDDEEDDAESTAHSASAVRR